MLECGSTRLCKVTYDNGDGTYTATEVFRKSDNSGWDVATAPSGLVGFTLREVNDSTALAVDDIVPFWRHVGFGGTWRYLTEVAGGGTNALLDGATHTDTVANTPTRGDIIVANASGKWDGVAAGASGQVFISDGTDPSWSDPGAIEGSVRWVATSVVIDTSTGDLTGTFVIDTAFDYSDDCLITVEYMVQPAATPYDGFADRHWTNYHITHGVDCSSGDYVLAEPTSMAPKYLRLYVESTDGSLEWRWDLLANRIVYCHAIVKVRGQYGNGWPQFTES